MVQELVSSDRSLQGLTGLTALLLVGSNRCGQTNGTPFLMQILGSQISKLSLGAHRSLPNAVRRLSACLANLLLVFRASQWWHQKIAQLFTPAYFLLLYAAVPL